MQVANKPDHWKTPFPFPGAEDHKYSRGAVMVLGGGVECTGAAKLAATAALRVCGLSMIAAPAEAFALYAPALMSVMARPFSSVQDVRKLVRSKKFSALLAGPGNGVGHETRERVLALLEEKIPIVLDADALTSFEGQTEMLYDAIKAPAVLTPHEGEFRRLFDMVGTREVAARAAAKLSGAVVVLKGSHTLIASPDGALVVNQGAPAWLATAGTGDVLAGLSAGLLAAGVPAFDAACMAVWVQSRAAERAGVGMIAEDLLATVPAVLADLNARKHHVKAEKAL